MTPIPKKKPYRNPKYLNYIRTKRCAFCFGAAQAHHIRDSRYGSGAGQKSHDYCTFSACAFCHDLLHKGKLKAPEESLIIDNLVKYAKSLDNKCGLIYALMEFIESQR